MTQVGNEERSFPRWFWVAAFLVGVAFLTLVRPLLQRIPDPPPELGALPEIVGITERGESYRVGGAGGVRVVQLVPADDATERTDRVMRKLGYVIALMQTVPLERVTVVEAPAGLERKSAIIQAIAAEATWMHVGVSTDAFAAWRATLPGSASDGSAPGAATIALVDADGRVRGWYSVGEEEVVSELYHRALHADRARNLD